MTKTTLGDLNAHLFLALERVNDEDLSTEALSKEMERAKVVAGVAAQIIANGNLILKANMAHNEYSRSGDIAPIPKILNG